MTREANEADVEKLAEMGEAFFQHSPWSKLTHYSTEKAQETLRSLINGESGTLLASDTGMLGAVCFDMYCTKDRIMQEVFWWSKGRGTELLKAFEDEGRKRGARFVMVSALENEHIERIDRFYRKMGYVPMERTYAKELT